MRREVRFVRRHYDTPKKPGEVRLLFKHIYVIIAQPPSEELYKEKALRDDFPRMTLDEDQHG